MAAAAVGAPDWGQAGALVLSALAALVTAVTGMLRVLAERRRRRGVDGPPDDDAPDKHEVWLDVLSRLSAAEEERDEWRDRAKAVETQRDDWEGRWIECNDERLSLLREKRPGGRRRGDGLSSS